MSEAELAYMADPNESFDLPRWQTHQPIHTLDSLSSSAQAAHAAQASYLYPGGPPPPPPPAQQRIPPIQQSPRQSRISQLLDQDQQLSSPYLSTGQNQLARSASLGGSANSGSSRGRRHHQPEDLEVAGFSHDNQSVPGSRQHSQSGSTSFYPSSVGYQPQSLSSPVAPPTVDPYPSDMYYSGSGSQPPKRAQTMVSHDPNTSRAAPRSPMRTAHTPTSASLLDPYSPQTQYPPATTYSYGHQQQSDQRIPPPVYHSHTRTSSQVKSEGMTPPITISSPYSPQQQQQQQQTPVYPSSSYAMDTSSSPHPSSQLQGHHVPVRSSPNTPLSYMQTSHSPASQYYSKDEPMDVQLPPQKRRASGFRRVRDARDIQPRLDIPPAGRRMDSTGVYLSVCSLNSHIMSFVILNTHNVAPQTTDDQHLGDIPYLQSTVPIRIYA